MTKRCLGIAFGFTVVASAFHFADNAARFAHYHDAATSWFNPASVVVAWFLQVALGATGFLLDRNGRPAGRPILLGYSTLGFAGFLHYLVPPMEGMDVMMHVLIAFEAIASAILLAVILTRHDATKQGGLETHH